MASFQHAGSSGPSSNINSPSLPPTSAQNTPAAMTDPNIRFSAAPSGNGLSQTEIARSKRNKRDSRKKREAKGLDPDSVPPKKKAVVSQNSALPSHVLSLLRPMLLADPRSSDTLPAQPRQMNFVYRKASAIIGKSWNFYEVVDKLTNKNGFRYSYAIADPGFPHIRYRQTDVPPYKARLSFEDSPASMAFTSDALAVTTTDPWHSARANVCAREGTYYYEARVISGIVNDSQSNPTNQGQGASSRGHIRLGFSRREADIDVNVGVDCYGYGIRDVNGEVINRMRCEYFFPKNEAIFEGDVIGMLITLPPLSIHKKVVEGTYDPNVDGDGTTSPLRTDLPLVTNIIRDRIPFHLKSDFCWQQSNIFPSKHLRDYAFNLKETPTFGPPSPLNSEDASLRTLPGSSITIFKNGVKMGTPFKELYAFLPPASRLANGTNNLGIGERENVDDGMIGYFPTVSCYGGGAVECRFESPWWFGPPLNTANGEHVRPFGERFTDQIAEDVVADIVDEIEAMFIWGGMNTEIVTDSTEVNSSGPGATEPAYDTTAAVSVADPGTSSMNSPSEHAIVNGAPGSNGVIGLNESQLNTGATVGNPEVFSRDGDQDVEMS
jgi:COMPASS component BRE2